MRVLPWAMGSVLLSALLASHTAVAQERFSTITGTVVDESGAAIPGVSVTLTHIETKRSIVRTTDASGGYNAREIEPGRYIIRCELTGFTVTPSPRKMSAMIKRKILTARITTSWSVSRYTSQATTAPLLFIRCCTRAPRIPESENARQEVEPEHGEEKIKRTIVGVRQVWK